LRFLTSLCKGCSSQSPRLQLWKSLEPGRAWAVSSAPLGLDYFMAAVAHASRRGLHSFAASRMGEDTNGFTASLDALRHPKASFSANSKAL
jgi:hypothetical protein